MLLAQRAKLVLRLPEARLPDALALQDATLDVGGSALHVGAGAARSAAAERHAVRAARGHRRRRRGRVRGGRRGHAAADGRRRPVHLRAAPPAGTPAARKIAGFALALHGLGPADSLRIQRAGIGGERRLGWGMFVPAKAIIAADE